MCVFLLLMEVSVNLFLHIIELNKFAMSYMKRMNFGYFAYTSLKFFIDYFVFKSARKSPWCFSWIFVVQIAFLFFLFYARVFSCTSVIHPGIRRTHPRFRFREKNIKDAKSSGKCKEQKWNIQKKKLKRERKQPRKYFCSFVFFFFFDSCLFILWYNVTFDCE